MIVALLLLLAPQEVLDPPRLLTTYLKVLQDDVERGYVHEELERSLDGLRSTYTRKSHLRLTLNGNPHEEESAIRIDLDRDGTALSYCATSIVNGSIHLVDLARPGHAAAVLDPALLVYSLRRSGKKEARLLDLRTDDGKDLVLSPDIGAPQKREYFSGKATVTPLTFAQGFPLFQADCGAATVFVDRYGRVAEMLLGHGVKVVIVRSEADLGPSYYPRRSSGSGCWFPVRGKPR